MSICAPEIYLIIIYMLYKGSVIVITFAGWFMVFNTTFNNISVISWLSVLLVEKTGVLGENHRFDTSH